MKTNRLLLLLLLPFFLLLASENQRDITLLDFTEMVSSQNSINIYIDEDLQKKNISLFIPNEIKNEDLFFIYRDSLKKIGYDLPNLNGTYYISKTPDVELASFFYKLKYNSIENVRKYLDYKKINYQYVDTTNTVTVFTSAEAYASIYLDIKSIDSEKKQVVLKFTIIEINEDKLNESGIQYSTLYKSADNAMQNVLNTLVVPFQSEKPIFNNVTFYGALKLFNEDNLLNIEQNPYILVQDSKEFIFQAVNNIPYKSSSTVTQASNVSNQTQIEYKDVGLKIRGKTLIYGDYVNLDLDLTIEDILNVENDTPTTYKRQLKSNTNLKYGQVLLLSGIKQNKLNKTNFAIPFISNIPYMGEIFKYKSENNIKSNISIAIEVLKNDESFVRDD